MVRIPEGKKARADTPGCVASVANTGLSDVFALGLYTNREPWMWMGYSMRRTSTGEMEAVASVPAQAGMG
jgi:hypothetical protein